MPAKYRTSLADEIQKTDAQLKSERLQHVLRLGVERKLTLDDFFNQLPNEVQAELEELLWATPITLLADALYATFEEQAPPKGVSASTKKRKGPRRKGAKKKAAKKKAAKKAAKKKAPKKSPKKSAKKAKKRSKKPAPTGRRQGTLPGVDAGKRGTREATQAFDKKVVDLVKALPDGATNKILMDELSCTRGKLRLSLERLKKSSKIEQVGKLKAARYQIPSANTGTSSAEGQVA